MWKYCGYCLISLLKKKTVWVSTLIYWLFFALILFIIPLTIKLSPFAVWGNSLIDFQSYTIIIFALICASATVVIFKDPKDDGTELIVFSKSITRAKIITGKFFAFFITGAVIIGVTCIFFIFAQFNGQYVKGDVAKYITSYIIGGIITFILFMAISIIVSCMSGKIGIMVSTIGISILLNLSHMALPMFATTPQDYINKKYNISFASNRVITSDDGKDNFTDYVSMSTPGTTEKTAWDYAMDANSHNTSKMVSYMDFGGQIGNTYFTAKNEDNIPFSSFGSDTKINYSMLSDENAYQEKIDSKNNNKFYAWPVVKNTDWQSNIWYEHLSNSNVVPGLDIDPETASSILTVLGATPTSVATVVKNGDYVAGNKFIDLKTISSFDDPDYVKYIFDKYLWYGQRWSNKPDQSYTWTPRVVVNGSTYTGNNMGYTIGNGDKNGSKPNQLYAKRNGNNMFMLFPGQSPYFGNMDATNVSNPKGESQYFFNYNDSSFAVDASLLLVKDSKSYDVGTTGNEFTFPIMESDQESYDGSLYDTPDGAKVPAFDNINSPAQPGQSLSEFETNYPEWAALDNKIANKTYPTHDKIDPYINGTEPSNDEKESVQDHLIKALGPYDPKWDDEVKLNVALLKLEYLYIERLSSIYWNPDRWYVDINGDKTIPQYNTTTITDYTNVSRAFASTSGNWSQTYYDKYCTIGTKQYTPFEDQQIIKMLPNSYDDIPSLTSNLAHTVSVKLWNLIPGQQYLVSGSKNSLDPDRQNEYKKYEETNCYISTDTQKNGIVGIKDMFPYTYSLFLTNTQEAMIWATVSFFTFGVIVVVYSKADFK